MNAFRVSMVLAATVAPLAAFGGDGVYEINQDCAAVGCFVGDSPGFPVTISSPGSYRLSSDLIVSGNPGSTNGIDITATGVDLDLGGHTIDGGGTCTGAPVTACSGANAAYGIYVGFISGTHPIRVHDGTVRGFGGFGVQFHAPGYGNAVERMTIAENGGVGLGYGTVTPTDLLVRDTRIVSNGNAGMSTGYGIMKLVVENCVFSSNAGIGLAATTGSMVRDNYFRDNKFVGLQCAFGSPGCAYGVNAFFNNNGTGTAAQYDVGNNSRDMGGNVCEDGTCP